MNFGLWMHACRTKRDTDPEKRVLFVEPDTFRYN